MSADNENYEPEQDDPRVEIRAELIRLADRGKIPYTSKYIKKCAPKLLETIFEKYQSDQLDAANEMISEHLIKKFVSILGNYNLIKPDEIDPMTKELLDAKIFTDALKELVGQATPSIPHVGLICGGLIISKYVLNPFPTTAEEPEVIIVVPKTPMPDPPVIFQCGDM